jgi:hypothetical protein
VPVPDNDTVSHLYHATTNDPSPLSFVNPLPPPSATPSPLSYKEMHEAIDKRLDHIQGREKALLEHERQVASVLNRLQKAFGVDWQKMRYDWDRPPERPGHVRLRVTVPARSYEVTADELRLLQEDPETAATLIGLLGRMKDIREAMSEVLERQIVTGVATSVPSEIPVEITVTEPHWEHRASEDKP